MYIEIMDRDGRRVFFAYNDVEASEHRIYVDGVEYDEIRGVIKTAPPAEVDVSRGSIGEMLATT